MKNGKIKKSFLDKVGDMMEDDPFLQYIRSRTPEDTRRGLQEIGVLDENGKISPDYINKFSGHSRGPKVAPVKRLKKTA